jgi:hypothetical protein
MTGKAIVGFAPCASHVFTMRVPEEAPMRALASLQENV